MKAFPWLLLLTAATSLHAQDVATPAAREASDAIQVVEVKPTRSLAVMPYRNAYDLSSKVEQAGAHRLHAVFRVTSPQSHQAVPGLRVVIEGENTYTPVDVSASGMMMPSIKGVGLCYPDGERRVSIDGAPDRAARDPDVNVAGNKVFCARFSAAEASEDRDRVLSPADGWEAVFW